MAGIHAPALRQWRALPVVVRDAALVAVLAVLAFLPALSHAGIVLGQLPVRRLDPLGVLVEVAMWFPLALRRWRPALGLGLVGTAFAVHELLGYDASATTLGLYAAVYSAGAHQRGHRRELMLGATAGYAVLAGALIGRGSPNGTTVYAAGYLVLAVCWQAGAWIRRQRAEEDERRRLSVEAAIGAEQARIARELHDVVTHHVTAMVVQADAAQFVPGAGPEPVVAGLAAISDTGRQALGDLRNLLGVLGSDQPAAELEPAPGRIADLVQRIRVTGQPVELIEDGERRAFPAGAELVVYRVAQEALTNALKHAPGAPTTVRLRHENDRTEIEIVTLATADEPLDGAARITGSGRGLNGLRERLKQVDGELATGFMPDGGFRVWARVPAAVTER